MICTNCGKNIDDDSKFCRYCGSMQSKIVIEKKTKYPENEIIKQKWYCKPLLMILTITLVIILISVLINKNSNRKGVFENVNQNIKYNITYTGQLEHDDYNGMYSGAYKIDVLKDNTIIESIKIGIVYDLYVCFSNDKSKLFYLNSNNGSIPHNYTLMKYDIDKKVTSEVKGAWSLKGIYYQGKYKDMLIIGDMTSEFDGPPSFLVIYHLINHSGTNILKIGDENDLNSFLLNNSEGFIEIKTEKIDRSKEINQTRTQKDISWRGNVERVYSEEMPSHPNPDDVYGHSDSDEYAVSNKKPYSKIRKRSIEGKWYMDYLSGVNLCGEDGDIVIEQSGREIRFRSLLFKDCRDQETGRQRLSWMGTYEKDILEATSSCIHRYTLGDVQYTDNIRYKLYAVLLDKTGEFEGYIKETEQVVEEGSIVGVNEHKSFVRITRYAD